MKFYRFLALMMAIIFAFSAFAACGTSEKPDGDTTAEETPLEEPDYTFKEYNVKDNIDNLKLLGRSLLYGDSILMDWSASGISFNFHGAETLRLKMTFQSEVNNGKADIVVTIDNKDYTVSASGKGARKYTVTTSLEDGDHSVTIRRKSMVESGAKGLMLSLESVSFAGYFLEKPADNTYKVAFVGDSITCGVGLDGKNEDGLATYAVNFVDNNNYDYDICAISGIGVQYSTEKHGYGDHNMAEYYPYYNYYRSDAIMYVPERKADFVVVNLNTNDNKGATEKLYKEAVKKLISEIRAVNGAKTPIMWYLGMMADTAKTNQWLGEVFAELGGESAGLYIFSASYADTKGGNKHPSYAAHLASVERLNYFVFKNKIFG